MRNFFRKLFGFNNPPHPPPPLLPANLPLTQGEPIRAFDKFGREILIPRNEWLRILQENIRQHDKDPDALANDIISALRDDFAPLVEDAARHLHQIDTVPSRGTTLLAIVLLQSQRPAEAEKLLLSHLSRHGEDPQILTHLAKAQEALGRIQQSRETLWKSLTLDPNQDDAFAWFEAIHREESGSAGSLKAFLRLAELPKSWRAQLWIARQQLLERQLDSAIILYHQALERAPRPVPSDLLIQMSGDLGNQGHIIPLLDLTSPHFDPEVHGIGLGNNLLKALIDTGNLDAVRQLLNRLHSLQRPDWKQTLGFWEAELHQAHLTSEDPPDVAKLELSLLTLPGPLWLPENHPICRTFSPKDPSALRIIFAGSSFESPSGQSLQLSPSNHPGRYSRAIPLLLAEHLHLHSDAIALTIVPWIANGHGAFAVHSNPASPQELCSLARMANIDAATPPAYVIGSHLLVRGENYRVQLQLIRLIDEKCVGKISADFPENAYHLIAPSIFAKLQQLLAQKAGLDMTSTTPTINGPELDHYLFRLEQSLAVSASMMHERYHQSLSNPAEILDGMLHLCLQNPGHLPSRMLYLRTLRKLQPHFTELVLSFAPKTTSLILDHPIPKVQSALDSELATLFSS